MMEEPPSSNVAASILKRSEYWPPEHTSKRQTLHKLKLHIWPKIFIWYALNKHKQHLLHVILVMFSGVIVFRRDDRCHCSSQDAHETTGKIYFSCCLTDCFPFVSSDCPVGTEGVTVSLCLRGFAHIYLSLSLSGSIFSLASVHWYPSVSLCVHQCLSCVEIKVDHNIAFQSQGQIRVVLKKINILLDFSQYMYHSTVHVFANLFLIQVVKYSFHWVMSCLSPILSFCTLTMLAKSFLIFL